MFQFFFCSKISSGFLGLQSFIDASTSIKICLRVMHLSKYGPGNLLIFGSYHFINSEKIAFFSWKLIRRVKKIPEEKILIVFTFNILFSFPLLRVRLLFCHYKYSIGAQLKSIIQTFFFKLCTIQKSQLYDPFIDEIAVTMY